MGRRCGWLIVVTEMQSGRRRHHCWVDRWRHSKRKEIGWDWWVRWRDDPAWHSVHPEYRRRVWLGHHCWMSWSPCRLRFANRPLPVHHFRLQHSSLWNCSHSADPYSQVCSLVVSLRGLGWSRACKLRPWHHMVSPVVLENDVVGHRVTFPDR